MRTPLHSLFFYSMIRNTFFALVLLFFSIQLNAMPAFACSCIPPQPPEQSFDEVDAVFVATVDDIKESPLSTSSLDPKTVFLNVSQSWKGVSNQKITIQTARDSASCGYNFEVGEQYLIYANNTDGKLTTGLCSRTQLIQSADEDMEFLQTLPEQTLAATPPGAKNNPVFVVIIFLGIIALSMVIINAIGDNKSS